jgi:hypothetical protein
MLLFQYLAGRGACLSQRSLPRTGAAPHRLGQRRILMFRSIRKSTSGSIRIINGLNAWCLTRRVRRWHVKGQLTPRLTLAEAKRPPRPSANFRRVRRDGCLRQALFSTTLLRWPSCGTGRDANWEGASN